MAVGRGRPGRLLEDAGHTPDLVPGPSYERRALPLVRSKIQVPHGRAMSRERLERLWDEAWRHRLTVVVAPAGSGKTTLLASWAGAANGAARPVAWYRVESTDAALPTFLAYVQLAIGESLAAADPRAKGKGTGAPWRSIEEAAAWLERRDLDSLVLIVDDCHLLAGSGAEAALKRLLDLAPPEFRVIVGSRSMPAINVSRWRLAGDLLEVTGEDLRFRSWEVERLFRDHYGEALRGDELGRLARRTEGWAAGLQFFHLAARDKSAAERARLLDTLAGSPRFIREYLARNVLDELPDDLRDFLVATCVLRRLSGPLCDRFLDAAGSGRRLEELERRQVFTVSLEDGTYRYHEVLQAHLEQILMETRGETCVRRLAARAAVLLEEEGALAEALVAYCRAEQWADAARVLGSEGDRLQPSGAAEWLADVTPGLIVNDPWLRLASARRLRAEGRWERSIEAFAEAESSFGASEASARCRAERLALAAFLGVDPRPMSHWSSRLREGLRRAPLTSRLNDRPLADRQRPDLAGDRLALGLLELAGGYVRDARATLLAALPDTDREPGIAAAAAIGAGAAGLLAGDGAGCLDVERGTAAAERAGSTWLARLGRAILVLAGAGPAREARAELEAFRIAAARDGDAWGGVVYALLEGWAQVMMDPAPANSRPSVEATIVALGAAAATARRIGAGSLEVWLRSLAALGLARLGGLEAERAAIRAETLARSARVPGALLPVYLALADSDAARSEEHWALAESVCRETGLFAWPAASVDEPQTDASTSEPPPGNGHAERTSGGGGADGQVRRALEIHLLGGFSMDIAGRPVNLAAIKPRPRAILRLLALNAGQPVHREVLAETFWPNVELRMASRNVHVAVSGLRKELGTPEGSPSELLVREGDAYRLAIPAGAWIDLKATEEALTTARAAHARGDRDTEALAFRHAIELGSRELLPEDGPADWVIYRREELRAALAAAARTLAESISDDDPEGAAEVCSVGLRLDPHHDGLWRQLIATHERAGDQASAETARQGYAKVLDQLGVPSSARSVAAS